jgi:hypothetical protein
MRLETKNWVFELVILIAMTVTTKIQNNGDLVPSRG